MTVFNEKRAERELERAHRSRSGSNESSSAECDRVAGHVPLRLQRWKNDLDELRTRLRKMNDDELLRFCKAARFMCRDKSPRQVFVIQLQEAESEWRRRHPKNLIPSS